MALCPSSLNNALVSKSWRGGREEEKAKPKMSPSENRKQGGESFFFCFFFIGTRQCRDIKFWAWMVPDLQVLPVRRRWGRRAASEALVPPTACRGSSRRGTPPSAPTHTHTLVVKLRRCVAHMLKKEKRKKSLKSTAIGHHNRERVPHFASFSTPHSPTFACMCVRWKVPLVLSSSEEAAR